MILLGDSKGLDQIARMRRLIWASAVRICSVTFSYGVAHIIRFVQFVIVLHLK